MSALRNFNRRGVVVRPAILQAFEAFEPESIGMETLAHETGLSQAIVSDALIEMARVNEITVTVEYIVIANDGTMSQALELSTKIDGITCYWFAMYRVNKDRKQEAA